MIFLDLIKANAEIGRLTKSVTDVTTDRDAQVTKLAEYEKATKDYIESAQTAEQMKAAHKAELDTLKADYEAKLLAKTNELDQTKADAAKQLSTVKESVAEETIRLVASQVTSAPIEQVTATLTPASAKATFDSLTGEAKQNFYNNNSKLILQASAKK